MRIHSDTLTYRDVLDALRTARADADITEHGSRSRKQAFNVLLTGESRRRPNAGTGSDRKEGQFAATWDQWGVFLAVLFERDPNMLTPYYRDADDFANQTCERFGSTYDTLTRHEHRTGFKASGWPADAHGDHTFRFIGTPFQNTCTKCTATKRWGVMV